MSECYKDKYIYNSNICDATSFNEAILENKTVVYEVVRLIKAKPFKLMDNYTRLLESSKIAGFDYFAEYSQILESLELLAKINSIEQGNAKIALFKEDEGISCLMYLIEHHYPTDEQMDKGVATATLHEQRPNPKAKIINKSLRTRANEFIREKDIFEAILVDDEGFITEGSRSNIFFVKDNILYNCPDEFVLGGTARKKTIEICNNTNIPIVYKRVNVEEISNYDAAFLTGTSLTILPIFRIDDIYFDFDNEIMRKIQKLYLDLLFEV